MWKVEGEHIETVTYEESSSCSEAWLLSLELESPASIRRTALEANVLRKRHSEKKYIEKRKIL